MNNQTYHSSVHPDNRPDNKRRAIVLHPIIKGQNSSSRSPSACLDEIVRLAWSLDLNVVEERIIRINRFNAATLFSSSLVEKLSSSVKDHDISMIIVNHALTAVQQRNLEQTLERTVIDRTGLILEIFSARARTHEGKLQVELATLMYQRARLVRSWTHLEKQRGGFGFLGGPGESQLEIDQRLITNRITKIQQQLEDVRRMRHLQHKARERNAYPVIALVGYTNAGKSTVFNRLVGSTVLSQDRLFTTLDPTLRSVRLPGGKKVILADTVGFISDLPTNLIAAFRATLEDISRADIILHVRDISHPDCDAQRIDVNTILTELSIDHDDTNRVIEVLNKIDLLPEYHQQLLMQPNHHKEIPLRGIPISAITGEGIKQLITILDHQLGNDRVLIESMIAPEDGSALAWLYRYGDVSSCDDMGEQVRIRVRLDRSDVARFQTLFTYQVLHEIE